MSSAVPDTKYYLLIISWCRLVASKSGCSHRHWSVQLRHCLATIGLDHHVQSQYPNGDWIYRAASARCTICNVALRMLEVLNVMFDSYFDLFYPLPTQLVD